MKIMKISIALIALSSLIFLGFTPLSDLSKNNEGETLNITIDHQVLHRKWILSHYDILGQKIALEEQEKKDYIHFKNDQTYISLSEGQLDKGQYKVQKSSIVMTNSTQQGELKLNVKKLDQTQLVITIEDPSDPDAKYFNIHYK